MPQGITCAELLNSHHSTVCLKSANHCEERALHTSFCASEIILQGTDFKMIKRFNQCVLEDGPIVRGC